MNPRSLCLSPHANAFFTGMAALFSIPPDFFIAPFIILKVEAGEDL